MKNKLQFWPLWVIRVTKLIHSFADENGDFKTEMIEWSSYLHQESSPHMRVRSGIFKTK